MDQMGRPPINAICNQTDADRAAFNRTPAQQFAAFLTPFVATFLSLGYSEADAGELAFGRLPDVLPCDSSDPAGYPNGRHLTDDISTYYSLR